MFDETFETFVADTWVSKSIHYNLRYQVYCMERRFENPAAFPSQHETDIYDGNSVHFIVRHRDSGHWVGAMRLVLAVPGKLPIARLGAIDDDSIRGMADMTVAEASRLCVVPSAIPDFGQNFRSAAPRDGFSPSYVTLGLIRAAREYCLRHEIGYSFFLITAQLARILRQVGMELEPVGPATNHRGLRRPYIHDFKNGYRRMRHKSPRVYEMFQASPAYSYHSKTQVRKKPQATIQLFTSRAVSIQSALHESNP